MKKQQIEQIETLLRNYHFKPIENASIHPNSKIKFTAFPALFHNETIGQEVHDNIIQTCGVKIAYKIIGYNRTNNYVKGNNEPGTYLIYYNLL